MSYLSRCHYPHPPRNLCELLLRDVASLMVTSRLVSRSLRALRPECVFSEDLTDSVDHIASVSARGETRLQETLAAAGAVLPAGKDTGASALVTGFFTRVPATGTPGVIATEIASNLRLLVQHIELKARLAAEEALLVGQDHLSQALLAWAAEWRSCSRMLHAATIRACAQAYVADVPDAEINEPPLAMPRT